MKKNNKEIDKTNGKKKMTKIKHKTRVPPFPMGVTLIGSYLNNKPNFMVAAWVTGVNFKPPIWGVTINKNHATYSAIKNHGFFSINIPDTSMVERTDYCGLASGKKIDKSSVFEVFYGEEKYAPMIKDCPVTIECKVREFIEFPTNGLICGDIITVYTDKNYLIDGKLNLAKIDPILLSMPENKYWSIGKHIADAWEVGKKLKKK